jgi:hypothetical protein
MDKAVAIIGGGPSGLMAAEVISARGVKVDVYDSMPSVGRKLLMAGKSGLNITHSDPFDVFVSRYGKRRKNIKPLPVVGFAVGDGPAGLAHRVFGDGVEDSRRRVRHPRRR